MSEAETNEIVTRLSVGVGIIMEDTIPLAVSLLPETAEEIDARLSDLDQACQDASALVHAAKVLARRGIR